MQRVVNKHEFTAINFINKRSKYAFDRLAVEFSVNYHFHSKRPAMIHVCDRSSLILYAERNTLLNTIGASPLNPSEYYCRDTRRVSGEPLVGPPWRRETLPSQALVRFTVVEIARVAVGCHCDQMNYTMRRENLPQDAFTLGVALFVNCIISTGILAKI